MLFPGSPALLSLDLLKRPSRVGLASPSQAWEYTSLTLLRGVLSPHNPLSQGGLPGGTGLEAASSVKLTVAWLLWCSPTPSLSFAAASLRGRPHPAQCSVSARQGWPHMFPGPPERHGLWAVCFRSGSSCRPDLLYNKSGLLATARQRSALRLRGSGQAEPYRFPLSPGWAPALEELLATCQYCGCRQEVGEL